ncbi:hypothetical protein TL18_04955 [Methanobrevibacter sp. YE315]|uniref:hypothetical protein n=1 Tax=Methanobrevibacter sp. YE315 TaxID=1609968 RepID=UPI000764EF8D|nr:hypothetical protein [Methanobrevibacter sp. YE315]AMD17424.1 hypothetical protein TL18_04955 [Methanobrevibacter sp. YE315]
MSFESCLKTLMTTEKPIFYKKGRHGEKIPITNREQAIKKFIACEYGAIYENDAQVEILDYDEIDWLS